VRALCTHRHTRHTHTPRTTKQKNPHSTIQEEEEEEEEEEGKNPSTTT
jgi:hypothetical protein